MGLNLEDYTAGESLITAQDSWSSVMNIYILCFAYMDMQFGGDLIILLCKLRYFTLPQVKQSKQQPELDPDITFYPP